MLYERIVKERNRLQQKLDLIQQKLSKYPAGKLICSHYGDHCKWYQSDGHVKQFISKSNRQLAEALAAKKYLLKLSSELSAEIKALDFYLRHHNSNTNNSSTQLFEIPGYQELLSPYFQPLSHELTEWMNASYEQNTNYSENLIHKTSSGHLVRSKSEAMIDLFLFTNRIPFRYECGLELDSFTYYPDFTIRHPKTGETYYWEHFGLMDDPSYRRNAFSKLQIYADHGILPSIQLITTYETLTHPLSTEVIEKIIEHYFL